MAIVFQNESDSELVTGRLERLAKYLFKRLYLHPETELSVSFVTPEAMEKLHIEWMDEPGATDVMSFPMDELVPGSEGELTPPGMLGDIVICVAVAAEQADAAGHSLLDECAVLLTHGVLHLLGYDHATPVEEAEMFGLQGQLLADFAAADPDGEA